jgi:hypothetical protein
MIKFSIIIPFRPKSESVDWERESKLLQQTIRSVLQQTYRQFKVFVLYNDLPSDLIEHEQVSFVQLPYGHQSFEEIPIREELRIKFKSEKMVVRRWDKARKLSYGSKLAREEGCHYIMALDADDLLSKHFFASLIAESNNGQCPGWYMHKGFIYKPGTGYLMLVPKLMRFLNGSTHVLRADLVTIPDFTSTNWLDYSLFTDHGWIKDRLKKYLNVDLLPITQPMLVYVVHGSNISKVNAKEYGLSFKNIIKRILRGRILTKKRKEEFNIT